jgi:hypothetical protein
VYLLWRSYKKYKEKQRRNSRGHRLGWEVETWKGAF